MASTPTAFKTRLVAEMTKIGINDPATLDKVATALSAALHDYITQDVQVSAGQVVQVSPANGQGATAAPGKLV